MIETPIKNLNQPNKWSSEIWNRTLKGRQMDLLGKISIVPARKGFLQMVSNKPILGGN